MLSMGHEILWLEHYEGLKVVLRTIISNLSHVPFNAPPCSRGIVLHSGYALGVFYENVTGGRTQNVATASTRYLGEGENLAWIMTQMTYVIGVT